MSFELIQLKFNDINKPRLIGLDLDLSVKSHTESSHWQQSAVTALGQSTINKENDVTERKLDLRKLLLMGCSTKQFSTLDVSRPLNYEV